MISASSSFRSCDRYARAVHLLTVAVILLIPPAFIQDATGQVAPTVQGTGPSDAERRIQAQNVPKEEGASEVKALRAQIDVFRELNAQMHSTVLWALGATITIAVIILGVGSIVNFRTYRNDVARLREDVKLRTSEQAERVRSEVQAGLEAGLKRLEEQSKASVERQIGEVGRGVKKVSDELLDVQCNLYSLESKWWEDKKVEEGRVAACVDKLAVALSMAQNTRVHSAISALNTAIKVGGLTLTAYERQSVRDVLGKIPKDERHATSEMITEIETILETIADSPQGRTGPPVSRLFWDL